MDINKMGQLISDLRKEKSMTQKELAEKLNVTDKAVSKWERGNGYPEITIIPTLADALGITINELLTGQRNTNENIQINEVDSIVTDTIEYVEKANKYRSSNIAVSLISAIFLLSLFVCLLCNYAISKRFDWSLYPAGALVVAWFTIIPLILLKKHRVIFALLCMTVSLIPYLFLIEYLCPVKGWVIPLALPITAISFVSLLVVIALFTYTRKNKFYILALASFLMGVVVNLSVKTIVDSYLGTVHSDASAVITALSFTFVSILLALTGLIQNRKA